MISSRAGVEPAIADHLAYDIPVLLFDVLCSESVQSCGISAEISEVF